MNKFPVLIFLLATLQRASAQLPAGAVAPDFTAQDINGQSWHLYDLLAQGKTVVLEISATWCPPCWAYHNGHALQDFYTAHGPEGGNEAMVLFVEGDPETNVDCLFGSAGCNGFTIGNWVNGTTYPIFDNAALKDSFQVTYYPTVYMICPNKRLYQVGQMSAENLWEKVGTCPVASGVNNAGVFYHGIGTGIREICDTLVAKPAFTLINLGSNALTSAAITLQWNDTVKQTLDWSGNLPLYGEAPIAFDPLPLSEGGILKSTVISVNNGQGDDDYSNNVYNENFSPASEFPGKHIILKIKTDNYGSETYWELRDEQGGVLYSGGNKNVGPDGGGIYGNVTDSPGTYGDNALITKTLTLPYDGCYSILFVDAYGDGMCCGYGNGFYKLYSTSNPTVPILSGGEFGATDHRGFSVTEAVSTDFLSGEQAGINIFPNPAGDQLTLDVTFDRTTRVSAAVFNTLGQVVYTIAPEQVTPAGRQWSIAVADWPAGSYFIHFQCDNRSFVRKFFTGK